MELPARAELGIVTDVNNNKHIARVRFPDTGIDSDWMPVLINHDFIPDYDVPQRTEYESGGGGYAAFADHKHDLIIKPWMPVVGQQVLVIYPGVKDADGVVVGAVPTGWRQQNS